ncbi:C-type lectin BfL-2 [Exaiptasia diaphana]|uniref:C-type lectin domain-containing protein n=1 Tax=Exaiptasia diaphana TaxID=2652724 RepID=A0A913WT27_EXADI|nr:C-type lectin BfL-2 [Exaiptasia diaphana]KXJ18078.1 C-type lectin BfL-2 [Exaiptasia diaphana]
MRFIKLYAVRACLIALAVVENKAQTKSSYYARHPGIQLQGHVIKNIATSNILNCMFECSKTQGCLSINSHNTGNAIHCELNKSNRYGRQANLIKTSLDHEYLEMVFVWPDACFQKLDGWHRGKSAAYKIVKEPANFLEARQRCQKMSAGADLVSLADKEEEETFDQYLQGIGDINEIWIGLSDLAKEGTFVWSDGNNSTYTNWINGEPNNYNGNEHCTIKRLENSWMWNDDKCEVKAPFACKVLCT